MSNWHYTSHTARVEVEIQQGAYEGVLAAAQALLGMSNALVPYETGGLESSGIAEASNEGVAHIVGQVAYGTNDSTGEEAIAQHERMDFAHAVGQAKYLEQPLLANAAQLRDIMAEGISKVIHGGHG